MEKNPEIDNVSQVGSDSAGSDPQAVEDVNDYVYTEGHWWQKGHLFKLNVAVFLITLSSTNNGYDGSMLNGLQSLPIWHEDMGK